MLIPRYQPEAVLCETRSVKRAADERRALLMKYIVEKELQDGII